MLYFVSKCSIMEAAEKEFSFKRSELRSAAFGFVPMWTKFSPSDFLIVEIGDAIDHQEETNYSVDFGINIDNERFIDIGAGASKRRNGELIFVREPMAKLVISWCTLQLALNKLPAMKVSKYIFLMLSSARTFVEAFGEDSEMKEFQPEEMVVLKDIEVECPGFMKDVNPTSVGPVEKKTSVNKITDGIIYRVLNDLDWSPEHRLEVFKTIEASTLRAKIIKGCEQPIFLSTLKRLFLAKRWSPIVKDFWGKEVNLFEAKAITFASVFKAAKCCKSWDEYCKNFHEFNDRFYVCVTAHDHKLALPYQQFQTLWFDDDAALQRIADYAVGTVLKPDMLTSFGSLPIRKILSIYPQAYKIWHIQDQVNACYASLRRSIAGGRIPKLARAPFCAPDTIAVFSAIATGKAEPFIKEKHVICSSYKDETTVSVTRCPHLDHAHCIRKVQYVPSYWRGLYLGHTCYISACDNLMVSVQADFDGDHLYLVENEDIVQAAINGFKKYKNVTLKYAAMDAEEKPEGCDSVDDYLEKIKELDKHSFRAPIGLYALALVKLFALGPDTDMRRYGIQNNLSWNDCVALLTRQANLCIDEAGHGADTSKVKTADLIVRALRGVSLPYFHRYAKCFLNQFTHEVVFRPTKQKYEIMNTHMDAYSQYVLWKLPKSFEEADKWVDFEKLGEVDPKLFLSDRNVQIKTPTGLSEEFRRIAAMTWDFIKSETNATNYMKDYGIIIRGKVAEWATANNYSVAECEDYLVYNAINRKTSVEFNTCFWSAYGDVIADNLERNLNTVVPENIIEEYEEEEEFICSM